ncbi:tetratricopeptide repeat protein [Thalassotalea sp. M1531]|uniref:Tetratricopeptide repeat protein n=1 Tax=Thalassotalea algicola TaxID=2716224 RepID=A0A7Y0Q8L8_9GAMM|nr:putative 2OG-Fe(II) oxygenase [Thalassotalea algicola]NMP33366.1 tetratricopeptide repeat protein [Thalassotalea algicola]
MFNNQQQLLNELNRMQQMLQKQQAADVISTFERLEKDYPNQPDLLHLAALAFKQINKFNESKSCFERSLKANDKQPFVHNNFANLLLAKELFYEAESHYKKAIALKGDYLDAWKNLAIASTEQRKFSQATEAVDKALGFNAHDTSLLTIKGNIFKAQEDFDNAIKTYQQVLQLNPNYFKALHNLGVTYKLIEQHDYAIACFNKAKEIAPSVSEVDFNLANTYFELGHYQQAEQNYWSALNKRPNDIEVHQTLNEFYWQQNNKANFGKSFQQVIAHLPNDIALRHAYAESIFSAGDYENAERIIKGVQGDEYDSRLLHTLGKIEAVRGQNKEAVCLFEQSLLQGFNLDTALDLINLAIVEADYDKALYFIEQAELREPLNQLLLAYKGTCWRLTNDERHYWLNDYERFVRPYQLAVPNGYSNLSDFLNELESVLLSMHQLDQAPLKQTLKNGTQTPGRLLHKKQPVIELLKNGLSEIVTEHITSLPDDNSHPLLSRKSRQFSFAGSWSVKLQPNGFHVNHVHPAGWLSSSFYIRMPELSEQQQFANAGAIKFGETSMSLGEREEVAKIIAPSPGTLALFPSYMWHGTIPFESDNDEFRLTSPFDVVPI